MYPYPRRYLEQKRALNPVITYNSFPQAQRKVTDSYQPAARNLMQHTPLFMSLRCFGGSSRIDEIKSEDRFANAVVRAVLVSMKQKQKPGIHGWSDIRHTIWQDLA